jgi:uncharacterized protein YbjT (DUF2867 family)
MNRVLVAGATGYLGKHIVKNLVDRGINTSAIIRTTSQFYQSNLAVNVLKAEVTNTQTLKNCCDGIDTIISTIGITRQVDGLSYMDVDYQANLNLLNEAKRSHVKKFIYVSALHGNRLKSLKIFEAKERFVSELQASGIDYCIIRPTGFFVDMAEFYNMALKGRVYLFGDGSYQSNPIHGEDLAKVCVDAINGSANEIEVGGPEILTQTEIAEIAFETINKPVKITYIPDWVRRMVLKAAKLILSPNKFGPLEFFLSVLVMDMTAPRYGKQTLKVEFTGLRLKNMCEGRL